MTEDLLASYFRDKRAIAAAKRFISTAMRNAEASRQRDVEDFLVRRREKLLTEDTNRLAAEAITGWLNSRSTGIASRRRSTHSRLNWSGWLGADGGRLCPARAREIGTGCWFRSKHEPSLVGVKAEIPAPAPGEEFESLIEAPVGRHSQKPMIETLHPGSTAAGNVPTAAPCWLGPASRNTANSPGSWQVWGNEADRETAE
jgi:hypothetical protein